MNLPDTRNRDFPTDRAAIAAGYRAYADLLDQHPEVPITYPAHLVLWVHKTYGEEDDTRQRVAELLRLLPGAWTKTVKDYAPENMRFQGWIGGVPTEVLVPRESVCERVVTGTREVTEQVRVGDDTRPVETVTREVEDVEWICSPLLAEATDTEAVAAVEDYGVSA